MKTIHASFFLLALLLSATASISVLTAGQMSRTDRPAEAALQSAMNKEFLDGNAQGAIEAYRAILTRYAANRAVAAKALLQMGEAYERLGDAEARHSYERVVQDFSDQTEPAAEARLRLSALGAGGNLKANDGLVQQRVWTNAYVDGLPSPDGRYIPWVDWPATGNGASSAPLMVHDLMTGEDRRVTRSSPRDDSFPEGAVFTPDGRHIVYLFWNSKPDKWQLRITNLDGSSDRVLLDNDGYSGSVSPDARHVSAVIGENGAEQIAVIDMRTSKVAPLTSVEWRQPQIGNFSADGRFFVYSVRTQRDTQDREIFAIATDGSSRRLLVASPGENRNPYFTPDGQRIVFASNRSGHWDLWALPISDGRPAGSPEVVKTEIGPITPLGFSRDGSFFYTQAISDSDGYEVDIDPRTRTASGPPKRITARFIHSSGMSAWSLDGQKLAYAAKKGLDPIIVVRDLVSGREREFTIPIQIPTAFSSLRWFPDGKSLLFSASEAGRRRFYQFNPATGDARALFDTPYSNVFSTSIAPDGRSFLFTLTDAGSQAPMKQVMRYDIERREQTVVYRTTGIAGPPAFRGFSTSPDGRQMAFMKSFTEGNGSGNWMLMVAPLDGGEPRELWRPENRFASAAQTMWDVDGRGVFVTVAGNAFAQQQEIWYVPIDGSPAHSIGVAMDQVSVSNLDPNGRKLSFVSTRNTKEVWVLKNLFTNAKTNR